MDFDLDIRGANLFIHPFHAVGLLITILIASFIFSGLSRLGRTILATRPALQTALYILAVFVVWYFVLPLGDWTAEQWERSHKTPAQVGDMGYGWYYWDDSGMGNWPMRLGYILRPAILVPVFPILWLTFCYLVFSLRALARPDPA